MKRLAFLVVPIVAVSVGALLSQSGCAGCEDSDAGVPIISVDGGGDAADHGADVGVDVGVDTEEIAAPDTEDAPDTAVEAGISCQIRLASGLTAFGPPDALDLTAADEPAAYMASAGLQFDFVATTTGISQAQPVTLFLGGADVATANVVSADGTLGLAEIAEISLPAGATSVWMEVKDASGATHRCNETTISIASAATCGVALAPLATGCTTVDARPELPGFQMAWTVTNPDGTCDKAALRIDKLADAAPVTTELVDLDESHSAEIVFTVSEAESVDGIALEVTAIVEDSADATRHGEGLATPYTFDNTGPTVSIDTPTDLVVALGDDPDQDPTNGVQVTFGGLVQGVGPESAGSIAVSVDGVVAVTTTPLAPQPYAWKAELSFTKDGVYVVEVKATDACGNTGSASATLTVFITKGGLAVVSPADGATLLAKDDLDTDPAGPTALVYETTFQVAAVALTVPVTLTVQCRPLGGDSPWLAAGSVSPAGIAGDDLYLVPVALPVDVLGSSVECRVIDDAINASASAPVALTVALPAPTLVVTAPADGFTTSQTAVTISAATTNLDGQTALASLLGPGAAPIYDDHDTGAVIASDGVTATVHLTEDGAAEGVALPDGLYVVALDALDTFGNHARDAKASAVSVAVVLDTAALVLSFTAPAEATLDPAGDVDPDQPGFQVAVTVTLQDQGNESGASVCLSANGVDQGCVTVGADGTATFSAVTLQPGPNALVATGADVAGNPAVAVTITPFVVSDAPVVTITSPDADLVTAEPALDLAVLVEDQSGAPLAGATVTLLVDGAALPGLAGTDQGGGAYTFTAVPIPGPGEHLFVAEADAGATPGFSAPRKVTLKAAGPQIAFTTPTDGQMLNKASPECAPGSLDCALTVTCATENVEDGQTATLSVTCGAATSTAQAVVTAGAAAFPGVVLKGLTTCALSCTVSDVLGAPATAAITVSVDRVAPKLPGFIKPGSGALIASDDLHKSDPGLQYIVQVTMCGLEAGQIATLEATPEGGAPSTVTAPVPTTLPDATCDVLSFPEATLPQGVVTLTVTVSDAAGNPAPPLSKVVQVVSDEPTVRISAPSEIPAVACTTSAQCAAGGICYAGTCARPWGKDALRKVTTIAFGFPLLPENLRACSDDPAQAGGPECATAGGFHEVFKTTMAAVPKEMDLSALSDGVHTLVVEVKLTEDGQWMSSMSAPQAQDRSRRVVIDTVAPSVLSVVLASDTQAPAGTLNAAELAAGAPVDLTANEDGVATVTIDGVAKGTQAVSGGKATVTIPSAALPDGAHLVTAVVTDAVGNASAPFAPALTPLVDTKAPTLEFTQPVASPVLAGKSLDVVLLSDALGQSVTLSDNGTVKGTAIVQADGKATFLHATFKTLTDGQHTLTATVSDAAGNPGAATSVPLTVDATPPVVTINAPKSIVSFADADDASPDGGFQVAVTFTTSGGATWELKVIPNCAPAFSPCSPAAVVASGPVTNNGGAEPTVTVTLPVFKTPDYIWLSLEVKDALGNMTKRTSQMTVTLTSCQAAISGLPGNGTIGNALCAPAGADCASTTLPFKVGLVGACGAATDVQLLVDGTVAGTQPLVGGSASFSLAFSHGTAPKLEAKALKGATVVATTGVKTYQVDLKAPVPLFVAKAFGAFTSPASGTTASYTSAHDQSAQAGLQIPLHLEATDDGVGGGQVTALTLTRPDLTSSALTGFSPALPIVWGATLSQDLTGVTLEDGTGNTVTATVTDAAGNKATTSFTYGADTSKPVSPSLAIAINSARRPSVTLSWTAMGGGATAYDIRYSRAEITAATFDTACDATKLLTAAPLPVPAASGTPQSYALTGPDARGPLTAENGQNCQWALRTDGGTYWFALRAGDASGNWSDVTASSVTSTSDLRLRSAKLSIASPGDATNVQYDRRVSAIGDINNDGFGDFALGGNQTNGICIIYGSKQATVPDLAFDPKVAPSGATWQCLLDGATATKAGNAKDIGDVNGDGLQDLGVGAEVPGTTVVREIRVYLGVLGGKISATPALRIQGFNDTNPSKAFAGGGNFNGDATAGGARIDDVVVGSRLDSPSRVFVVPGSTAWPATTLDLTKAADRKAFSVVEIDMTAPPTLTDFGQMVAFVGNLLPDSGAAQYDDLVVGAGEPTPGLTESSQAVIFKGRALTAGAELKLLVSGRHDQQANAAYDDKNTVQLLPDGGTNVFASESIPMLDVNGDGVLDLFIGHAKNKSPPGSGVTLYLFDGKAIQAAVGGTVKLAAATTPTYGQLSWHSTKGIAFGGPNQNFVEIGNFDDGPTTAAQDSIDIAYVKNDTAVFGSVYVRLNTDNGTSLGYGTYPWIDLELKDPYNAASQAFGNLNVRGVGDANGDGLPDLVVGTNGSGYAVLLY